MTHMHSRHIAALFVFFDCASACFGQKCCVYGGTLSGPEATNIVLEAESGRIAADVGAQGDNWEQMEDVDASGGAAMACRGEKIHYRDFQEAASASRIDYDVKFPQAGAYFAFVRGRSLDRSSGYVHVGIDGKPARAGDRIGKFGEESKNGAYVWLNQRKVADEDRGGWAYPRALIFVTTPGRHTVNMWSGSSGIVVDNIVLAPSALTTVDDSGIHDIVFDPGDSDQFDIVIYGGTLSGWAAAIQAARDGHRVVLLERTGHIGNISINGVNGTEGHTPLGHSDGNTFGGVTVGGLNEELYREIGKVTGERPLASKWEPHVGERVISRMLVDSDTKVRFGQSVRQVNKDGPTITSIAMNDGTVVHGSVFIDASYEGDLMARAKVSYTFGREGHDQYNEPLAGIQWQRNAKDVEHPLGVLDEDGELLFPIDGYKEEFTMGAADFRPNAMNFQTFLTTLDANKVGITPPDHYNPSTYEAWRRWLNKVGDQFKLSDFVYAGDRGNRKYAFNDLTSTRHSKIGFSTGSRRLYWKYPDADYEQQEAIDKAEKDFFMGLLYFLGYDPDVDIHQKVRAIFSDFGLPMDEYVDNDHIAYWFYVRSARRLVGQYVLTQHDVDTDNTKDDSIATIEHKMDIHNLHTVAVKSEDGPPRFQNEGYVFAKPANGPWEFPYRALLPIESECDNLLVSVAVSSSNIAHSSCRTQTPITALGQAAGAAASMAVAKEERTSDINVAKLREKLISAGVMVDRP